jgi:hypothetical protein
LADTGPEVVSSAGDYFSGKFEMRSPLHNLDNLVIPDFNCGVQIPANVLAGLGNGTGLRCDFTALGAIVMRLPEEIRAQKLCAALASVGRVEFDELRPIWEQHEWGRLYARAPALVNMPKVLLPALRTVTDTPLWEVDFSSFELRIAAGITGQKLPEGDAYGEIAGKVGISRGRVKGVVNPMLHGQTKEQCRYAKEPNSTLNADRPLVEREMACSLPRLMAGLDLLRRDHSLLQRKGAGIFFGCMGIAMEQCGISFAYLPKHDGWLFGGTEAQAKGVREEFQSQAERMTGSHFPAKLQPIY